MALKENKRNKIIKAALTIFSKKGFHASSMSMVAKMAKVSVGTIYIYFRNEDDLIHQIFNEIKKEMASKLSENLRPDMNTKDKFIIFWQDALKFLVKNPEKFRYLEQYVNSPYGIKERKECLIEKGSGTLPFIEILNEGINKKIIKNLPIEILVALSMGPMASLARDSLLGFINIDEDLIKICAESCFRAISNEQSGV